MVKQSLLEHRAACPHDDDDDATNAPEPSIFPDADEWTVLFFSILCDNCFQLMDLGIWSLLGIQAAVTVGSIKETFVSGGAYGAFRAMTLLHDS